MREYWITKHALTRGIEKITASPVGDIRIGVIRKPIDQSPGVYFHTGDHHETREQAVAKAKQMRLAKIKKLKKQIAKLEAMKIE